jgi:ribA/ribD-fused uncharacterized protein
MTLDARRNCVRVTIAIVLLALAGCRHHASAPAAPASATLTRAKIDSFQGEYRFLSNFYPATVEYQGIMYPTVEHAYQSAKTLDMNQRRRIAQLPSPAEAKVAGRALPLRPDWGQVKFEVMTECVRYKFTHSALLREQLLATGDAYLEEGNTWGDQIWGVYQGKGQNHLGLTLMQIRDELRHQPK